MKLSTAILFLIFTYCLFGQRNQAITHLMDTYAQHNRLSGVALVQQDNAIIFAEAYGCANYENSTLNEVPTIFNIGSISKQFTAAAILHLVQEGKIDLSLSINSYLGKYSAKHWKKISVHHLLSHTSGIPSLLQSGQGLDDVFPEERAVSLAELIGYFRDLKLISKSGKKYNYNNSGYVLLAAIIEEISGQSYGDFMKGLFEQYGLESTSHGINENQDLAFPYYGYTESQRKLAPKYHPSWFIGAGSIYSSITDLAKWNQTIHSDTFLNADLRKRYFQKHEESDNGRYYAYGWEIMEREDKTCIHHDGTTFGYTCDLLYEPTTKILSIILTNQTHESLYELGKSEAFVRATNLELMQIMQGKNVETLPVLSNHPPNIQEGVYTFTGNYQLEI
ncbi:MAG: serine hydrolase domain-containing protein [Bacteroidota bacterium]